MFSTWHEVIAVCENENSEIKNVGGHDVYIRGELSDLFIVQVPKGADHKALLAGIQEMIKNENIEKGVLVLDNDINLMKLVPVEKNKAKGLEANYQASQAQAEKQTKSIH